MNARQLYNRLETDFRLSECDDDWSNIGVNEYIIAQYLERYMGLVTDNAREITYVYTAVFPSRNVISKIIGDGRRDALLFVHHPMEWDINIDGVFFDIPLESLRQLKERNISIYNLHVPLDRNGTYGTTYNLANALGIQMTGEFCEYYKVNIGVIGTTDCKTVTELKHRFQNAVGHEVKLYPYGEDAIKEGKTALVAGGGNDFGLYPQLRKWGINTFITGITRMVGSYPPSIEGHQAAKEYGVNILAGTHYSTEKFACMKMVEYFAQLDIQGEFVPDAPCMDDM